MKGLVYAVAMVSGMASMSVMAAKDDLGYISCFTEHGKQLEIRIDPSEQVSMAYGKNTSNPEIYRTTQLSDVRWTTGRRGNGSIDYNSYAIIKGNITTVLITNFNPDTIVFGEGLNGKTVIADTCKHIVQYRLPPEMVEKMHFVVPGK